MVTAALPCDRGCQLCSRSATSLHARAGWQAVTPALKGPEKGLPGAALAFEEPYILSLDDSAGKGHYGLVIWSDTHIQQGLHSLYWPVT